MIEYKSVLPNKNPDAAFELATWEDAYLYYLSAFVGISQIVFEYENMPPSVNVEYMEKRLLYEGYCFFFKDDVLDYLTLGGSYAGLDVYGWPVKFIARGQDGKYTNDKLNNSNCVMMFDTIERMPIMTKLEFFANRLADIVIASQTNIKKQKYPYLISADQDTVLTVENIIRDINANASEVFVKKGFNKEDITVWNLSVPLITAELREEFNACFNEALTFIGIPNVQMQKRERMITDEVNRSLGGAEANSFRRYQARLNAVERINDMFGLDIKVKNRFWTGKDDGPFATLPDLELEEVDADE